MKDITKGTEKQIAWATEIRDTMIGSAQATIADPKSELDYRKAKASLRNLAALDDAALLIDFSKGTLPGGSEYRGVDPRYFMTATERDRIEAGLREDRAQAEAEVYGTPTAEPADADVLPVKPRRRRRLTDEERAARDAKDARVREIIHRLGENREAGR